MSLKAPPTLLELARQRLLRNDALDISVLQYLPKELIPRLFMEAFTGRRMNILREIVAIWPFPCLPVGAHIEMSYLEMLKAVLDGVDKCLTHKVHQRIRKLQVLDLRNVQHSFWNRWAGMEDTGYSAHVVSKKQIVKDLPRYALRRRLKVLADLSLKIHLSEYQTYLLQWAEQRKSSLQLCCPKMQICALPVDSIQKVLKIVRPEYIEELDVFTGWDLSTMSRFSRYLGQMRNLHKLYLARIHKNNFKAACTSPDLEERCVTKLISQFSRFNNLQHLSMNGLHFLSQHMKQLFSCLKTPLETLYISRCPFTQCDLNSLRHCQSLCRLKHLSLRGVIFFDLRVMDLRVLLETVAATLKTLELEQCRMQDSQISVLLPALSQCSHLTTVNFYDNYISMAVLQDLLHHTTNLTQLTLELYPAPLECYDDMGEVLPERFAQICPQLMNVLRAVRQPKTVSFATNMCLECCSRSVYDQETRLCHCWQ